jgi:transposase
LSALYLSLCLALPGNLACVSIVWCFQFICSLCLKWKDKKHQHGTVCNDCHHNPPAPPAAAPAPRPPSPQPPLFPHPEHSHSHLPPIIRSSCVTLKKEGHSTATTAEMLAVSERSVRRWESHFNTQGDVQDEQRSGRPRSTDENTDINIALTAIEEPFAATPKQVKRKLGLEVSARTVRRRLDEAGLHGRIARREHRYDEDELAGRLAFAHKHKDWTVAQWEQVVCSDEVHVKRGHHGKIWVQRPAGEAYDARYMMPGDEELAEGENVTMWGCFCAQEIGTAEIFIGDLTGAKYATILRNNLVQSVNKWFGKNSVDWYFLHDNVRVHTAPAPRLLFHTKCWQVLDFPTYSPDLNPIENLWFVFKEEVERLNPETAEELEEAMRVVWESFDAEYLTSLMHSMPKRLAQVIANNGHKTHY